jgi:hypothetical protein
MKNLVNHAFRTLVVLGFACTFFACEDNVTPQNVNKKTKSTTTNIENEQNKPTR